MDKWSKKQRSEVMSRVRNRDTTPEITVRKLLHRLGYRFRLHRKDLPGTPDIVLPQHRKVVFVHGCFWHGHDCRRGRRPSTSVDFWTAKLDANLLRDRKDRFALEKLGWEVLVVWECELTDLTVVQRRLVKFLEDQ